MYIRTSTTRNPLNCCLFQRELNKSHIGCIYPARMWHIVLLQSKRDGVADISTTDVYATAL